MGARKLSEHAAVAYHSYFARRMECFLPTKPLSRVAEAVSQVMNYSMNTLPGLIIDRRDPLVVAAMEDGDGDQ